MRKMVKTFLTLLFFSIIGVNVSNAQQYIVRSLTTVPDEDDTVDQEDLKNKTLLKMNEWTNLIKIIGDKRRSEKERNRAIEAAVKLFIPDATIDVSSKNNSTKSYDVASYLQHLKNLNYREVTIDFYEMVSIGNFEKGEDGNYYSNARYYQNFVGKDASGRVYSDKTVKETNIIADVLEKYKNLFSDGEPSVILLGDITVVETN